MPLVTRPNVDGDNPMHLRKVLGHFATGVTVISTENSGQTHGMTANAFMSVSLTPAIITVSVRNESRMLPSIVDAGFYGVSILSQTQVAASNQFAGRMVPDSEVSFVVREGIPTIAGAVAQIGARLVDTYAVGDHTLMFGEIAFADSVPDEPLIFYAGQYRALEWEPQWAAPEWPSDSWW